MEVHHPITSTGVKFYLDTRNSYALFFCVRLRSPIPLHLSGPARCLSLFFRFLFLALTFLSVSCSSCTALKTQTQTHFLAEAEERVLGAQAEANQMKDENVRLRADIRALESKLSRISSSVSSILNCHPCYLLLTFTAS